MRTYPGLAITLSIVLLTGGGCFGQQVEYEPAPPAVQQEIEPNLEGARASTGGHEATITPSIDTEILVSVLPEEVADFKLDTPVEQLNPVPLPDGTATLYTSLAAEYSRTNETGHFVRVNISDTRGIPVLLAFIDGYQTYENDLGYRKSLDIKDVNAWLTYDTSEDKTKGTGSVVLVYRDRFLFQVDGSAGVTEEELTAFANAFDLNKLK